MKNLKQQELLERIFTRDYRVWKDSPQEISNRLGWLDAPEESWTHLPELRAFVEEVREEGFTQAILLGMGGSSLAPEVLRKTFGVAQGYLDLSILDSTDPQAVLLAAENAAREKTLFIVSTKSGGTVETLSFFKYFYNRLLETTSEREAGKRFIAITDPGSPLVEMAKVYNFRRIFLNNPEIGGRYSALSLFGIIPGMLIGLDVERLLDRAIHASRRCREVEHSGGTTPLCLRLGVAMAENALNGRDKLTLLMSPQISAFGSWVEQLIAESTGKEGKGILPVVSEPLGAVDEYGKDRFFVHLVLEGEQDLNQMVKTFERAGHPVMRLTLRDLDDLGAQFFIWEMATAVAGAYLGINPFDQPNVEAAKKSARQMVQAYRQSGSLPSTPAGLVDGDIRVSSDFPASSLSETWDTFLSSAQPGGYLCIQAFVQPSPEVEARLQKMSGALRARSGLAVTYGFGPRFLHSTGQLHKGDAGKGLFVQITADDTQDVDIPDKAGEYKSSLSFGVLKTAQAMGDRQALLQAGRKVITYHLGGNLLAGLQRLQFSIQGDSTP